MVNPAGSSLLAAQIYGSTAQKVGVRDAAQVHRPAFDEAAREAGNSKGLEAASRNLPVDKVDIQVGLEDRGNDRQDESFEGPGDAQRFAREAPGTSEQRNLPPGSRLDISV